MNAHTARAARREADWVEADLIATRDVSPTIREFTLRLPYAAACAPGSHLDVRVLVRDEQDHRSYSVVGHDRDHLRIAVKRVPDSRGGSAYMWSLQPGVKLQVGAPRCDFAVSGDAPHYLLLAGGVGVTPMVAMARHLASRGERVRMAYAARDASEFAYLDELTAALGDRLELYDASQGQMLDIAAAIDGLPADGQLYMCGPLGLMDAVRHAWAERGRPPAHLRYETFGSSGRFNAQPFTVNIPRLDMVVNVPANQSMLDALDEAGVAVLYECRRGECGLCALEVLDLEGAVDHRDVFFSENQHAATARICACVSRMAGGSITIDPAFRGDDAFFPNNNNGKETS